MSTRSLIEQTVASHPGIGFRQLQRYTDLSVGTLQYHLHRSDQVEQEKGGLVPRGFCGQCRLHEQCEQTCLRKLLNDPVKRSIADGIAAGRTQQALADELGLDPSTISYHVETLRTAGLPVDDSDTLTTLLNNL